MFSQFTLAAKAQITPSLVAFCLYMAELLKRPLEQTVFKLGLSRFSCTLTYNTHRWKVEVHTFMRPLDLISNAFNTLCHVLHLHNSAQLQFFSGVSLHKHVSQPFLLHVGSPPCWIMPVALNLVHEVLRSWATPSTIIAMY